MTEISSTAFHENLVEAWKNACSQLANPRGVGYVLATSFGDAWPGLVEDRMKLDQAARATGFEVPSSVASMLCPRVVRNAGADAADALEAGQRMFGRGRRKGISFSGWGHTYFERITGAWYDKFGRRNEIKSNRLLSAIEKLNTWSNNSEASLYLHTDLPSDTFRTRGSPCLQYLQLRAYENDQLSLTALYRAHDYSNKALGNFLGIRELGLFIAERTGRRFKGANVVSLHPFLGSKARTHDYVRRV